MKIDARQSDIETFGDVKEFKTGIDPKNLEFITTLLSSNLYSSPEQSFIREIVSNAWDSHVEAGNTDTPVIVKFTGETYNKSVIIRDYGTGLSPERFKEVYCNIGSSTKRESNDFIGGFGIGKYSSLACSNTVYITSYYEGKAYYYVMVKSGNVITTNLLMEKPTTEKNGVEVSIRNIYNIIPYKKALDYIVFFPNVYFDGTDSGINNVKLKRYNHFAVASINIDHKLLLGNVLYPCDTKQLSDESRKFLRQLDYTGIVIRFEIGELSITPNRESIIYSSDTINKINTRIAQAKAELYALISAKLNRDYDNIEEYYNAMHQYVYDPILDTISNRGTGYFISTEYLKKLNITFKGHNLSEDLSILAQVYSLSIPSLKTIISNGIFYTNKVPYRAQKCQSMLYDKIVMCNAGTRLIKSIKAYLRVKYDNYSVMTSIDYSNFEYYLEENIFRGITTSKNKQIIIQGVYDALMAKVKKVDFNTDAEYQALKCEIAANKTLPIIEQENVILYIVRSSRYKNKMVFSTLSRAVKYIKGFEKGIILTTMDGDNDFWYNIASLRDFVYIKAKKETVHNLRELKLSCLVDINKIITKDKILIQAATVNKCIPDVLDNKDVRAVCETVTPDIAKAFEFIYTLKNTYCSNYYYKGLFRNITQYDSYIESVCNNLLTHIEKYKQAQNIVNAPYDNSELVSTLTTAIIVKQKGYKVSANAYSKVKNNKLIKVLCKKS